MAENLSTGTAGVRRYTVTTGALSATGNFYPWFTPEETYNPNTGTGSSVSLSTYTARWQGTAGGAFNFASRGASFNFLNPWFDMASNYGMGYSLNASGQVVNDQGIPQTLVAGRRQDSGWSQEYQPTIYVRPAPVDGTYSLATDLNGALGNTSLTLTQFSGFVDGDFFQPSVTTTNGVATATMLGFIRGNNGTVYDQQGLSTVAPSPYGTMNASMFSTTRTPTSQAAGGWVSVEAPTESAKLDALALNDTNKLEIRVFANEEARHAVLFARLDNLGKGASGAAVQNIELMLGL